MKLAAFFVGVAVILAAGATDALEGSKAEDLGGATGYLEFSAPHNVNGSFEAGAAAGPAGWVVTGASDLRWRRENAGARTGTHSMVVRADAAKAESLTRLESFPFAVREGDVVKYGAWVMGTGTDTSNAPAIFAEAMVGGEWVPLRPRPWARTTRAAVWFPLASSVVIPRDVSEVRLVASADAGMAAGGASWRIDDFHCSVISLREYVETHRASPRLPDVLLLGADTLRQSPLGCYGSESVHTPNIDLLAREGVLFEHVMTCSSWTRPSFASIFTSLYPSQHTAELHDSVLPASLTTLAELLQAKGYFTAAFARTQFDGFVGPGAGFAKGFDVFFHADDELVVTEAFNTFLLSNAEVLHSFQGGLFIFRHFYEPHAPYENRWPDIIVNEGLMGTQDFTAKMLYESLYRQQPGVANAQDIEYALRIYESEAHKVDSLVSDILAPLRYYGLYDSLNVILCSDHGESFNEKPGAWNHVTPYNTCTEVPLIMRLPGRAPAGTRVGDVLASNLDIMPTILEIAGIEAPAHLEGRTLLAPQAIPSDRLVFSEDRKNGSLSIRNRRYKLVAVPASLPRVEGDAYEQWKSIQPGVIGKPFSTARHLIDGPRDWVLLAEHSPTRFELYDLDADPFENHDISGENVAAYRDLLVELLGHCARVRICSVEEIKRAAHFNLSAEELARVEASAARASHAPAHAPSSIDLSPDTRESLENQGYF